MASETKEEEEKDEEELSLVSTKVPKARVRFISLVLQRSRIHLFLFSLSLCCARRIFPRNVDFCFLSFFFNVCIILREEERMSFSLFPLSVSLSVEKTFLSAMVMVIVVVCLRQRRSNDR